MKGRRVGLLLSAAILLGTAPSAFGQTPNGAKGTADDPAGFAKTTQASVDRAKAVAKTACDKAAASQAAATADPGNVNKAAVAAADAADCATANASASNDQASLDRVNGGVAAEPANPALPADVHNPAAGAVKSDNLEWLSNSRGLSNQVANP